MAFCLIWFPKRKRYFMDFFNALIHNTVFMSAVTGWFAAQVIKTVIYTCITKSFDPERLVGSGGMPSSHSATVCALATAAGMQYGGSSFEFAIAAIVAIIVMYDARGVRRETGLQAQVINEMMEFWERWGSRSPTKKSSRNSSAIPLYRCLSARCSAS